MNKSWLVMVCFLFLTHFVNGQADYAISGKSIKELNTGSAIALKITPVSLPFPVHIKPTSKPALPSLSQQFLAPYDVKDLAFFCRLEVKIEKKIGLPFKFRLGEVQYTERLEGKY